VTEQPDSGFGYSSTGTTSPSVAQPLGGEWQRDPSIVFQPKFSAGSSAATALISSRRFWPTSARKSLPEGSSNENRQGLRSPVAHTSGRPFEWPTYGLSEGIP